MRKSFPSAVGAVLAALLTLGIGSGWAQDAPPGGQGPGQDQGQAPGQGQGAGRGWGGMMGMPGAGGQVGTVTAVTGTEITFKNEQGETYKVQTGPNTRVRKDREEAKLTDIHPGDVVMAAGNVDTQARTIGAMFVVVLDPQQAAQMKQRIATFGKTWTAGKVTAIKDLTVTIERPDKVSQTVAVDENTAFHKRSRGTEEDITFPDVKVGDMVNAQGAVKGGSFVATSLSVMEMGRRGPGRPGGAGGAGPDGAPVRPAPQPEGVPSGAGPNTAPAQPPTMQQD